MSLNKFWSRRRINALKSRSGIAVVSHWLVNRYRHSIGEVFWESTIVYTPACEIYRLHNLTENIEFISWANNGWLVGDNGPSCDHCALHFRNHVIRSHMTPKITLPK